MLYWCGIREGELLALMPADFDLDRCTLTISKSYQRLKGRDVITAPKTPKSNRTIKIPRFLTDEMRDYLRSLYGVKPTDRIFPVTKYYLRHEMDRGAKAANVKRIRIYDLRHTYAVNSLRSGDDVKTVQENLGHHTAAFTLDKYGHVTDTMKRASADRMEQFIQSIPNA